MMTYHEKIEYLTKFANKLSNHILDLQTELSELRILLQVEKDLASKEYPGDEQKYSYGGDVEKDIQDTINKTTS